MSPRLRTPTFAIWTMATAAVVSTIYAPAYSTLTTVTVVFLYISYVMPTAAGFLHIGKGWTRIGPFDLGAKKFRLLGGVSVLFVLLLTWIGVQPPNGKALIVIFAMVGMLLAGWWLGARRTFPGPPVVSIANKEEDSPIKSVSGKH